MNHDNLPKPPKFMQLFCTIFFSIAAMTLLFCSLYLPPKGEIHPTVIASCGMLLMLIASSLGIDYNNNSKYYQAFSAFLESQTKAKNPKPPTKTKSTQPPKQHQQ